MLLPLDAEPLVQEEVILIGREPLEIKFEEQPKKSISITKQLGTIKEGKVDELNLLSLCQDILRNKFYNVNSKDDRIIPGQCTPPRFLPPYDPTLGFNLILFVTDSRFFPKKLYIVSSNLISSIGEIISPSSTQKQAYLVIPVILPPS